MYWPTKNALVDAAVLTLVSVILITMGPVHAGDPLPAKRQHTASSAIMTNIIMTVVAAVAAYDLLSLIRSGGAFRAGRWAGRVVTLKGSDWTKVGTIIFRKRRALLVRCKCRESPSDLLTLVVRLQAVRPGVEADDAGVCSAMTICQDTDSHKDMVLVPSGAYREHELSIRSEQADDAGAVVELRWSQTVRVARTDV